MSKRARSSISETVWLWRAMKPVRPIFVHVLLALGVTSLLATLDPLVLKWLIDDVLPLGRLEVLPVVAAAYFLIYFFRLGLNGLSAVLSTYASQRVGFSIRQDLMRHLFAQNARFQARRPVGEVMFRIDGDVTQSTEVAANLVTTLARVLVVTTLTVTIMLMLSWRLSLVVFPLVPCVILIRRYLQPRLRAVSDRVQEVSGARNAMLQEQLSAVSQIQLLRREAAETRRFGHISRELILLQVKRYGLELLIGLAAILVLATAATVVIAYGGLQVVRETMTLGSFIAFYTYLSRLFDPIDNIAHVYTQLQRTGVSVRRIRELLEEDLAPAAGAGVTLDGGRSATVQLRDLAFAYDADKPVLRGVTLDVAAGEKVAIVGESGCGKSTIAQLLLRMYEPAAGELRVGGERVRDVTLRSLRTFVAYVPQDPLLFDVTLKENLRYANPNATDDELAEAVRVAALDETIGRLPNGWETPVGARGSQLSGGERQRVAIARALLQKPRVLILDEATSALDSATEAALLARLREVLTGTTTIVVAHRLSAILWADRIVVLREGRVAEQGPHVELYNRHGEYRRLCDQQFQGERPAAPLEDVA